MIFRSKFFLAVVTAILCSVTFHGAYAQADKSQCAGYSPTEVKVEQKQGEIFLSSTKTAFEIAREKAKRYDVKMPMKQGSMGRAKFFEDIKIEIEQTYSGSCAFVKSIKVALVVKSSVEIANDFAEGTCLHDTFYDFEIELMQHEIEYIGAELERLRDELRLTYSDDKNLLAMPASENPKTFMANIHAAIAEYIQSRMDDIELGAFRKRYEYDYPEFYEEAEGLCGL